MMMYRDSFSKLLVLLACLLFSINASAAGLATDERLGNYPKTEAGDSIGDVNGDSIVSIKDVTLLIDLLLNDGEMTDQADVNGDGLVSIKDVTFLIDMLLTGTQSEDPEIPTYADAPSILVLGNSFTSDSWAYVPYLLKEYGINIKVGLYYRNAGSLSGLKNEFVNGPTGISNSSYGFYYFDTSTQTGWEERIDMPTAQQCVQYYDGMENDTVPDSTKMGQLWDIILFQQVSTGSYIHGSYGLANNTIIPPLKEMIDSVMNKDFSYGWNINHTTGGEVNDLPVDVLDNIKETCDRYGIDIIFPYGTGIFNGRNYEALKSVGYGGSTDLWYGGQHLAGGLPHYLASITIIEALFRQYYQGTGLTVLGNSTIPDSEWVSDKTMPNGRAKAIAGATAENCALAQTAAINACNDPWNIYCDTVSTIYESWPVTIIIKTNASSYIADAGGYTIINGGTAGGITTSYIHVPRGTTLTGLVIRATAGHTISNIHSWRYNKYDQTEFITNPELSFAYGNLPVSEDNAECNIGDYDNGNGLYVDHNLLIMVYGTN